MGSQVNVFQQMVSMGTWAVKKLANYSGIRPLFPIAMATEVVLWCHWSEQQIGDKNLISSLHDLLSVMLIKPEDMIKTNGSML